MYTSFDLTGTLLSLCSSSALSSNNEENLVKFIYDRLNDFVDVENNDRCACVTLNLSKAQTCLYNSSNSKVIFFC